MEKGRILIICGTNRKDAVSRLIAEIYSGLLQKAGVSSQILDLADLPGDFAFSALYENSGKNEAFNPFRALMAESTKFVFVVPEYNGSFPGVLKTFIDGLEFPQTFTSKKCGLIGVSSGMQGAGLALSHLTDILHYCGCEVLSFKPKLARIEEHMDDAIITTPLYMSLLEEHAGRFLKF